MYVVTVDTFEGMERQYFESYTNAYNEYARLMRFGRRPYLYPTR